MSKQGCALPEGSFMGDGTDGNLDKLLKSCARKFEMPQLPGFGRELQPYFEGRADEALPGGGATAQTSSPSTSAADCNYTLKVEMAGRANGRSRSQRQKGTRSPLPSGEPDGNLTVKQSVSSKKAGAKATKGGAFSPRQQVVNTSPISGYESASSVVSSVSGGGYESAHSSVTGSEGYVSASSSISPRREKQAQQPARRAARKAPAAPIAPAPKKDAKNTKQAQKSAAVEKPLKEAARGAAQRQALVISLEASCGKGAAGSSHWSAPEGGQVPRPKALLENPEFARALNAHVMRPCGGALGTSGGWLRGSTAVAAF
eukprot:jgi/Botrbrau1/10634/Bobra.154_1s0023.1